MIALRFKAERKAPCPAALRILQDIRNKLMSFKKRSGLSLLSAPDAAVVNKADDAVSDIEQCVKQTCTPIEYAKNVVDGLAIFDIAKRILPGFEVAEDVVKSVLSIFGNESLDDSPPPPPLTFSDIQQADLQAINEFNTITAIKVTFPSTIQDHTEPLLQDFVFALKSNSSQSKFFQDLATTYPDLATTAAGLLTDGWLSVISDLLDAQLKQQTTFPASCEQTCPESIGLATTPWNKQFSKKWPKTCSESQDTSQSLFGEFHNAYELF